jgi:TM2 domain-containing membrane protein YozV
LQILPSFLLLGGIGRLYAGHTGLGIGQLLVGILIGWTSFWCGFLTLFLAWFVTFGIWLWFLVDGILVLTGRPVDQYGRLLRP